MKSVLYLSLGMGLMACGQKSKPTPVAQEKPVAIQTSSQVNNSELLNNFQAKPVVFTIHPAADTVLKIGNRGTLLHIPKNSFVNEQGSIVKDPVSIEFKEYTNAAEMAFSGIPMSFKQGGKDCFFSSSGMFDVTGTANGKPVGIAGGKALKIDYALVKKILVLPSTS